MWQMFQWITTPFSFMRSCNHHYGDRFTVTFNLKFGPLVFFSNPEALKVILTGDDSKLFDAPGELNTAFEPLLGAQSVIGLSGDRHRRMRQLLMPSFHGERMRSYGQVIQDVTKEVMNELVAGEPLDVRKIMQKISLRVILRAVFGLNEGPRYQQLELLLANMLDKMSRESLSILAEALTARWMLNYSAAVEARQAHRQTTESIGQKAWQNASPSCHSVASRSWLHCYSEIGDADAHPRRFRCVRFFIGCR
jgi:cytochrome P450